MTILFEQIIVEHLELQTLFDQAPDSIPTERLLHFIDQARMAGEFVADGDQRTKLRAMIKQWAVEVYRRTEEQPLVSLVPLDQKYKEESQAGNIWNSLSSVLGVRRFTLVVAGLGVLVAVYGLLSAANVLPDSFNPFIVASSAPTPTFTLTSTPTSTPPPSHTPAPTVTPTSTPSSTPSPSNTPALTPTSTPSSTPTRRPTVSPDTLIVADFDSCSGTNNLGGAMGAAYNPGADFLLESYVLDPNRGCVAKLEYTIEFWSAFWMKLNGVDLSPYAELTFEIRAEDPPPEEIKIEIKRANNSEVAVIYVQGVSTDWQQFSVNLDDFGLTGFTNELSALSDMEELVFTFEAARAGSSSVVYLDNIRFEQ